MSHAKRKRDPAAEVSFESLVSPNFDELSRRFPEFGRAYHAVLEQQRRQGGHFASCITQDFSIELTKALLHVHWGLSLTLMPVDRLCPPVPNRFYFVQWMLTQVEPSSQLNFHVTHRPLTRRGLDIGTGASAIYPLLLAAQSRRSNDMPYHLFATDIDAESIALARENVRSNQLESQITVLQVPAETNYTQQQQFGPLRQSLACLPEKHRCLDFCLTNPPFFDDADTIHECRQGDGRDRTNMSVSEGSYPGGEFAFCLNIFVDGLVLWIQHHQQPQMAPPPPLWSACMCGKKSTWLQLKAILSHVLGPGHVMATEFGPGHLTRWFLAWSFEQPALDSPLAMYGSELTFDVPIDDSNDIYKDAESRFAQYFDEFPDATFKVVKRLEVAGELRLFACGSATSEPPLSEIEKETRQLPANLRNTLAQVSPDLKSKLFPPEGEALKIITLTTKPQQQQILRIHVDFYAHTAKSKQLLDKIRVQLVGEICRTNRRWRRRLKQQQCEPMTTD